MLTAIRLIKPSSARRSQPALKESTMLSLIVEHREHHNLVRFQEEPNPAWKSSYPAASNIRKSDCTSPGCSGECSDRLLDRFDKSVAQTRTALLVPLRRLPQFQPNRRMLGDRGHRRVPVSDLRNTKHPLAERAMAWPRLRHGAARKQTKPNLERVAPGPRFPDVPRSWPKSTQLDSLSQNFPVPFPMTQSVGSVWFSSITEDF